VIYGTKLTIPKSTTQNDPVRQALKVTQGLVYRVELFFPPGSAGLAGLSIIDGGITVWPAGFGNWFVGDQNTVQFDDLYIKNAAPFEFQLLGYNEDDTYDHSIWVRIGLVSERVFQARFLPSIGYEYFQEMLKKLQTEQEAVFADIRKAPFSWLVKKIGE